MFEPITIEQLKNELQNNHINCPKTKLIHPKPERMLLNQYKDGIRVRLLCCQKDIFRKDIDYEYLNEFFTQLKNGEDPLPYRT